LFVVENPAGNSKFHFVIFYPRFLTITGFYVEYFTGQLPKSSESGKSIIALFPTAIIGTINFYLYVTTVNSYR
jgi:hypothetical protein